MNQAVHKVATMCRVLGVSSSGYYAWRSRPSSSRLRANVALRGRIEAIHKRSRGTYGSPRVHAQLHSEGETASLNRVARVMRVAGLCGVTRRKGWRTTVRDPQARAAPDLVKRHFHADAPDRLWVSDITYCPTAAGFVFLAVVLDVFSRRVVGWSMADHLRTEIVVDALEMALSRRSGRGVTHHSDQGSQYTAFAFGKRCRKAGVHPSMGSVGDCYDNAMAESFFATLECELIDRSAWATRAEARSAIFEFIEGWYNPHRLHSSLGYRSPVTYESEHEQHSRDLDADHDPHSLQTDTTENAGSFLQTTLGDNAVTLSR